MKYLLTLIVCFLTCSALASTEDRSRFVPLPEPKPEVVLPSFLFIQDNKLDVCLQRHHQEIQEILDSDEECR